MIRDVCLNAEAEMVPDSRAELLVEHVELVLAFDLDLAQHLLLYHDEGYLRKSFKRAWVLVEPPPQEKLEKHYSILAR